MTPGTDARSECRPDPGTIGRPSRGGGVEALPSTEQLGVAARTFALLADPTRLAMMWLLASGDHDVTTLAQLTGAATAAASQHLAKLRLAGLVACHREGRRHVYRAQGGHVRALVTEALYQADHAISGHPPHE